MYAMYPARQVCMSEPKYRVKKKVWKRPLEWKEEESVAVNGGLVTGWQAR